MRDIRPRDAAVALGIGITSVVLASVGTRIVGLTDNPWIGTPLFFGFMCAGFLIWSRVESGD
jgi:hypothetical protein